MKIAVDAFGGDNAPLEVIKGAVAAKNEYGVDILLTGNENIIKSVAVENNIDISGVEIAHTEEVFDMHDQPTDIVRSKKNTSLGLALQLVADDKADAFVSAGSTGAVVAGATFIVKRIKGVKRPALGTVLPSRTKKFILMDCGANAECRPEMLQQFGIMASLYMQNVEGVENPEVGLLNIGTEDTKGTPLQLEAYKLLKESPVNFVGNVESREMPAGVCDCVIADGFTGNIALKLYEGVAMNLMKMIKGVFTTNLKTKISYLLAKNEMKGLKKFADYGEVGGAPLLGVKKPVIKAHGGSNAKAIKNAIRQAKLCIENDVINKISSDLASVKTADVEE
ncbi:MAG: phosphate acyltransferase PlsX [Clostridia bacterium]|nr:phosphate acyltransferase PlsX [Clostridia bacterium]